ncbi:MAG: MBL fold metallo-hydrolase [Chloroflexi bacterium]|nr:MBL fold metallo-hydrolase [Chloroflexota bacterium]
MNTHQLKIGDIECAVLREGESDLIAANLSQRYPGVSQAQIDAALAGQKPAGSLNLPYIKSGGLQIIADVGFGHAARPSAGGAEAALSSLGITPADINIVYLTHFHGDHIAGFFNSDGAPVYPNALYVTMQAEWDEWMGRWSASEAEIDQQNLSRFGALHDRFGFVADGEEIAPGVSAVNLAGHTLGHSGLLVESAGDRLLHVVDILHQPFQFAHTDWRFSFDSNPERAVATRRKTLHRCADEGILSLFYHLPFPGLGKVTVEDGTFVWIPAA